MPNDDWLNDLRRLWCRRGQLGTDEKKRLDDLLKQFRHRDNWDEALQFFWNRLDELDQCAWRLFYDLMGWIMKDGYYTHYQRLPEQETFYVQQFITHKVLEPAKRLAGSRIHCNALRLYYSRFLIDCIPPEKFQPIDVEGNDGARINVLDLITGGPRDQRDGETNRWMDSVQSGADISASLEEVGLDIEQVAAAGRQLLTELADLEDDYARILLRCHFCATKDEQVPLSHFGTCFKNHYQRARRLGIIPGGTQIPDYLTTRLGCWLTDAPNARPPGLGLRLEPDYRDAIMAALTILCRETLSLVGIHCERFRHMSNDRRSES